MASWSCSQTSLRWLPCSSTWWWFKWQDPSSFLESNTFSLGNGWTWCLWMESTTLRQEVQDPCVHGLCNALQSHPRGERVRHQPTTNWISPRSTGWTLSVLAERQAQNEDLGAWQCPHYERWSDAILSFWCGHTTGSATCEGELESRHHGAMCPRDQNGCL